MTSLLGCQRCEPMRRVPRVSAARLEAAGSGRARSLSHDYRRHGTTDLFTALNLGTREVLHQIRMIHKGPDVLALFRRIDPTSSPALEIHVV